VGRLAQVDDAELAADVRRSYEASLARLEALGAEVVEVSVPALDGALAAYYLLSASEASTNLARFDGLRYGRRAAGGAAEELAGLYRESRSAGFGPEVKRRILLGTFALSAGYHEAWYQRAQGVAETLRRQLAAALEEADLLATPTAPGGAFAFGARRRPLSMYLSDVFTVPASLAGLPALALPCGRDAAGLPLSLQLVGRSFDEATVLAAGHALEGALDLTYEPLPGSVDRADAA
jgi:aspartyl-tRNA(Asn)/glutamyl-tRNA(Gln) amidotransferase subunit A